MSSSASDADASSGHASSDPDFASDGEPAAEEIQETAAKRKRVKRKAKPRVKRKANAQPAAAVPAEKRLNPVDIENMLIADIYTASANSHVCHGARCFQAQKVCTCCSCWSVKA